MLKIAKSNVLFLPFNLNKFYGKCQSRAHSALCARLVLIVLFFVLYYFVNDAVYFGFVSRQIEVTVGVFFNPVQGLAGMPR